MPKVNFTLNGQATSVTYESGMHFLEVLREELEGRDVVTLEGMPEEMRRVLGEAFVHEGGIQCGFCIPGILVRASSLLRNNRTDDREAVAKALDSHLCRCTGYARIIDAVQTAGEMWNDGKQLPRPEPRRHSYFGEEFGLSRNTLVRGTHENGIGHSISRYLGLNQALGEKPFIDDMRVPGMLHGAAVLSDHPRAKILAVDTADALAMPGVVKILTAPDVPGQRGTGLAIPDLPVFVAVGETSCCVGDMFALVIADTAFHARQAAEKVNIEYQVLEPV